ncbi:hypothetical protein [Brevibacterium casei]|uniref:Uncharacterized protein n=2 Tax=Brevibacterium casei TaxID=33889 RepID=A0A269ZES6_9MICO|nr:hypothetical protein [Brevibacterium casei]PAK95456.1 hypothetical protein B8X04_09260 [Brevibacterium casei]QPR39441.1 hypothetical protein I6G94_00670 [Brevibacterium casei]QPR43606.1 hypothetical protein I6G93_15960 [Brevibacterium casei]SMX81093.1 hypothetical protein BC102111_01814 [Brevibacterium casei CIP 102111]VEW15215.1 Uncharacterised protein [Brevibacterium casei]
MSSELNPTLRVLPYLLGITAMVFVGFPLGRDVDVMMRIAIGALTYAATFFLSRFVIGRLADRSSAHGSGSARRHGTDDSGSARDSSTDGDGEA